MSGLVRVAFVGAGGVHFGTPEGRWDHASRLERMDDVTFVAIVDPNVELAQSRLAEKLRGQHAGKWSDTKVYASLDDLLAVQPRRCDAVFIGVPPAYHGAMAPAEHALELRCAQAGMHVFIEKPISIREEEEVDQLARALADAQSQHNIVIAVGYMLRYARVVEEAQRVLAGRQVVAVLARYHAAYSEIRKPEWWDISRSGGPIIEQATHFCDLMRVFGGEVDLATVAAISIPPTLPLSDMAPPPYGEHTVPLERRIDRATSAIVRFQNGAVGSFVHSAVLHGNEYDSEIEILSDGMRVLIQDIYRDGALLVRDDATGASRSVAVPVEDMYERELNTFISAVRSCDASEIRSTFDDAVQTWRLSKHIARAARR